MERTLENGVETVDGRTVELYDGKISNTFEIDPDVGIGWVDGDRVAVVMIARVGTPKYVNMKKSGQIKKVIQLQSEEIIPMSTDKAMRIIDLSGGDSSELVKFDPPVTISNIFDSTPLELI